MGSGGEPEQEVHRDCVRSVSRHTNTLEAHITEMIEWREMIAEQQNTMDTEVIMAGLSQ